MNTLQALVQQDKNRPKYNLATNLTAALEKQIIEPEKVLLAFVKQTRKWLSLQLGAYQKQPIFQSATNLLIEFGPETWYGPIYSHDGPQKWYIKTIKVPFYEQTHQAEGQMQEGIAEKASSLATYYIRWTVIAELGANYVALSWNRFRKNETKGGLSNSRLDSPMQFPYW